MSVAPGTLYVIALPLGNPEDLSPRAVSALRAAEVIFAEDTRTANKLLHDLGIDRPTHSCFDANEPARASEAAALLAQGKTVGLVAEAGTPTVSDPGYRLVRAAIEAGARVVPVPGPAALLLALVGSGLPPDRFFFAGFPPRKPGPRRALLEALRPMPATLIFYESPHRTAATLADLSAQLGPDRPACVARELTKTHEEFVRGTLATLAARYAQERPLGEITLVVGGAPEGEAAESDEDLRARASALLASGLSARDVAQQLAEESGRSRREIYALVLALRPTPPLPPPLPGPPGRGSG
jgi:16S rRNA (cytidine1402-2'-O)-methyltransferase